MNGKVEWMPFGGFDSILMPADPNHPGKFPLPVTPVHDVIHNAGISNSQFARHSLAGTVIGIVCK
jgi:hypothetical protein